MTLPNFLICGIQKGGTTSLYYYLREHPDIYMTPVKELNFFNLHYERGLDWYEEQFSEVTSQSAIGEASPLYMWNPEAAPRIAKHLPDARLIFILRDPIERAYSNYWFNISRGAQDPKETFEEAIKTERGFTNYLSKGFYFEQLSRFSRYYNRSSILIIFFEELHASPDVLTQKCFNFLRVELNHNGVNSYRRYNPTRTPRNVLIGQVFHQWSQIRNHFRARTPHIVKRKSKAFRQRLYRVFFKQVQRPPLAASTRKSLEGLFQEQNEKLAATFAIDLSRWNNADTSR